LASRRGALRQAKRLALCDVADSASVEERRFRRKTLSDRGAFGGFLAVFFRKIAFAAWNFGANPL
jgi:hypothetical protein